MRHLKDDSWFNARPAAVYWFTLFIALLKNVKTFIFPLCFSLLLT